jgi:hypothetical protein
LRSAHACREEIAALPLIAFTDGSVIAVRDL